MSRHDVLLVKYSDISAGIGARDLRISETVPARDIEQPILLAESDAAIGSDNSCRAALAHRRQSPLNLALSSKKDKSGSHSAAAAGSEFS
jgi:hypothetical protein